MAASTGTRLQVVLARAGIASRRASEALILDGDVSVNGRVVTELGTRVDAEDRISVRGKPLRAPQAHCYILLNKPREVVTTASDPEGRRTVLDFVPALKTRVWPVGRLDYHSEGLVILTNDGDLTQALTHPSRHVPRVYHVKIDRSLGADARAKLRKGVRLDGHLTGPIEARPLRDAAHSEEHSWIEVTVHEGRYHLVREALARVGHPVSRLKRVAFGPLKLGRTPAGAARDLLESEVEALRKACRLGKPPLAPKPARPAPPRKRTSVRRAPPTTAPLGAAASRDQAVPRRGDEGRGAAGPKRAPAAGRRGRPAEAPRAEVQPKATRASKGGRPKTATGRPLAGRPKAAQGPPRRRG